MINQGNDLKKDQVSKIFFSKGLCNFALKVTRLISIVSKYFLVIYMLFYIN